MPVVEGTDFTVTLVDPGGIVAGLGARIEVPVSRQIVTYWRAATLSGSVWTVNLEAPPAPGDYQIVWMTTEDPPVFETFVPLFVVMQSDVSDVGIEYPLVNRDDVLPDVDDVALLERTRTIAGGGGGDTITFTDDTRPTKTDVTTLIEQAADEVLGAMPDQFDPGHYPQVKRVITLYTAVLIEGSFYTEQSGTRQAPLWRSMYQEALAGLQNRVQVDLDQAKLIGVMEPRQPGRIPRWREWNMV